MAIERAENPATGEEIVVVKGIVEKVFIKEIPGGTDKFGNTHRASILVGEDWVNNVNLKTREGYDPQVRFNNGTKNDPDWVTLDQGDAVRIVVTESPWTDKDGNDRVSLNSGVSKIKLVKKGSGGNKTTSSSSNGGQKQSFQKKDMSGVQTGHAINVAINVISSLDDVGKIINYAKKAHDLTTSLMKEYAEKNPSLSDYDVGAMVGQSVLSASHYTDTVAEIEPLARQTLDEIVPAVSDYVRGGNAESSETKTSAKKTTKRTTKKEATPERVDDDNIPSGAFEDDDSIPF